jgi:two-component system CheB/CheR fusion protein
MAPTICLLADDADLGSAISDAFARAHLAVTICHSGETLRTDCRAPGDACLVVDVRRSGPDRLEFLKGMKRVSHAPPAIALIARGDVRMAVKAMGAGALDCIEMPFETYNLFAGVERALARSHELNQELNKSSAQREAVAGRLARLTPRERQIMELVLAGHPNKNIAADLGVSQRTVESHRAAIMKKCGTKSLPALVRLALGATANGERFTAGSSAQAGNENAASGAPGMASPGPRRSSQYYPNLSSRRPADTLGQLLVEDAR